MTRSQLAALLEAQTGGNHVAPGYNHVIFSVRVPEAWAVFAATVLRNCKAEIEAAYREAAGVAEWELLPHVCLVRKRSLMVATPFDTQLNTLGTVLEPFLAGTNAQVPSWS
jgi:hypothetical protein